MRLERPPRHSWLKRIHSGHVLGTAALLTPALGVFGPKLIATLAILTVAALLGLSVHDRNQWTLDKSLLAILGSLGAWITVTFWWSIDSGETFAKWGLTAIAGLTVVYLLSDSATLRGPFHQSLQNLVLAGIAIGFASILFEVAAENALSRNLLSKDEANIELINRSTSVLLVFIWLAVTILWQRAPSVALGIVALGFAIGYILPSASALLGYVAGSFAFLCAIWTPRVTSAVVAAIFSLGILTAPILPTIVPPLSNRTTGSNRPSRRIRHSSTGSTFGNSRSNASRSVLFRVGVSKHRARFPEAANTTFYAIPSNALSGRAIGCRCILTMAPCRYGLSWGCLARLALLPFLP